MVGIVAVIILRKSQKLTMQVRIDNAADNVENFFDNEFPVKDTTKLVSNSP